MAKDPAFLFYSKDWLEGTGEMTPEEKGVYIDLLAHQHQKGSLPTETKRLAKLVGLSEQEFCGIWADLSTKFVPNGSGRLVNRKLNGIVTERLDKGYRNKIIGTLAAVVRYSNVPKEIAEKAKKSFRINDFLAIGEENLTERITEWYHKRLKSIGNANENGNANGIVNNTGSYYQEATKGNFGTASLIGQMMEIWMNRFPAYTQQKENDGHALRSIADFIFQNAGIPRGVGDTDSEIKALNTFELIADQVNRETFWVNKSLKSISSHIQEFYNKIKNPINGTGSKQTKSATVSDDVLKQKAADYLNQRRQAGC